MAPSDRLTWWPEALPSASAGLMDTAAPALLAVATTVVDVVVLGTETA